VAAPATLAPEAQPEPGWRRIAIEFAWPPGEDARWHLDALVAREVFAPILARQAAGLAHWRFHRRAGRDAAGHRFSFLFYSTRDRAAAIARAVRASPALGALRRSGLIDRVSYPDLRHNAKPRLGDTADPRWSGEIQRAWPYFIQGVSRAWLGLVDAYAARHPAPVGIDRKVELYREIHRQVSNAWHDEGGHAFLHHLSGVFAYQPISIVERRDAKF
jgi:hypothetical protein